MKDPYFTPATLASKALELLQPLAAFTHRQAAALAPERSALLVLDMQAYFLDKTSHACAPSAEAILPGVVALMHAFSRLERPVFITQHLNTPQDAGLMATWWHDLLTPEHPFSQVDARLELPGGIHLPKTRYDAFLGTSLEQMLHERHVDQVVICGVLTHLCCETTARSAFMRGFEVFFTVDGTATYNEAFHRATLLNLAHGFATPILVKDILARLEKKHGG